MRKLENWVQDRWVAGEGVEATLVNPATEEPLFQASTAGIDRRAALEHARRVGGPNLRALDVAARAALLEALANALHAEREPLITLAMENGGNTRGDAKFDIDGAIGTLAAYAKLGADLGATRLVADGAPVDMGRSSRMQGRHLLAPRLGCAVHINAFNFPAWGFAEKAACALVAGMPVLVKPGTISAAVAHRMVEIIVEKGILPAGALTLLCGAAGDLLDHVDWQDCIAFTGSAATGRIMRAHRAVVERGARLNVEADSLNCAILGPDVESDSETFDLFVRDVVTDMTQKAGQKCTAIRRVIVPAERISDVRERLAAELSRITVGDPRADNVRMGPLAGPGPHRDAVAARAELLACTEVAWGDPKRQCGEGAPAGKGWFMHPLVLQAESAEAAPAVHAVEVFGPVCTLVPYDGTPQQAAAIVAAGQGGLVASFYSDERDFATALIEGIAPYQGRLTWGSKRVAGLAPGPGTVFPQFVHGGPGRAGGGEELGGLRGLGFYMQRLAIQGFGPMLDRLGGGTGE